MINYPRKLIPPKMSKEEKEIYTFLKKSKLHKVYNHWDSFKEINDELDPKIKSSKKNSQEYLELLAIKEKLNYKKLEQFKNKIHENAKTQSENQHLTCYYCEEVMDNNKRKNNSCKTIEHIIDKKREKQYTFAPFNLVSICNACNTDKGNFDVILNDEGSLKEKEYMIIHPYIDNKEDYLSRNDIGWAVSEQAKNNNLKKQKAVNTIDYYNINDMEKVLRNIGEKEIKKRRDEMMSIIQNNSNLNVKNLLTIVGDRLDIN